MMCAVALLPAEMVQGAVTGDGRRPTPETRAVAAEAAQVARDLQPGFGGHVLGVVADQPPDVADQAGLHQPVRDREPFVVPLLSSVDSSAELRVVHPHTSLSVPTPRPIRPTISAFGTEETSLETSLNSSPSADGERRSGWLRIGGPVTFRSQDALGTAGPPM